MTQFKKMKMRINNPDHSKAVQEWLFEQGYSWGDGKRVKYTQSRFIFTNTYNDGGITHTSLAHEFTDKMYQEIDVQHLDPHASENPHLKHNYSVEYTETGDVKIVNKTPFDNMLKNLAHVQKAIDKAENKQQKRLQDRDRMVSKINSMLPEGWVVQRVGDSVVENGEGKPKDFDLEEISVGSVWEYTKSPSYSRSWTVGDHYAVTKASKDCVLTLDDEADENGFIPKVWLQNFKRIS